MRGVWRAIHGGEIHSDEARSPCEQELRRLLRDDGMVGEESWVAPPPMPAGCQDDLTCLPYGIPIRFQVVGRDRCAWTVARQSDQRGRTDTLFQRNLFAGPAVAEEVVRSI